MLFVKTVDLFSPAQRFTADLQIHGFRLSNELLKRLKTEARKQNRSLNNFVESVLMDAVYRTPNAKTLAAVKEARENINLETINLDNLEGFIESL